MGAQNLFTAVMPDLVPSHQKINHAGERAFIVTQSIKKLNKDDKKWALDKTGFKRVSDDMPVELSEIPEDDNGCIIRMSLIHPTRLHQRLIVTYSPKFARYQKTIRDLQVERAKKIKAVRKHKKKNGEIQTIRHVS